MGKKVNVKEYQCELIKVVDGDTIDCYIDLGFNMKTKKPWKKPFNTALH